MAEWRQVAEAGGVKALALTLAATPALTPLKIQPVPIPKSERRQVAKAGRRAASEP